MYWKIAPTLPGGSREGVLNDLTKGGKIIKRERKLKRKRKNRYR
jgi:hypothetical protein